MYGLSETDFYAKREASGCSQRPTILSTSSHFYKADFGEGGTLTSTCKGIVAGPIHYLIRSNRESQTRRQRRRPSSLIGQDASDDCPGALFS